MLRKLLIGLLIIFVLMQLYRPEKNSSTLIPNTDILKINPASVSVSTNLKNACYDCHSNHTNYKWYAEVAPVSWFIANHVNEGKEHLNFSTWETIKNKKHAIEETIETLEKDEMPLASYVRIHPEATLNETQKKELIDWFKNLYQTVEN